MAMFSCVHGELLRRVHEGDGSRVMSDIYEVRTNWTTCLIDTERDEHGEFYVDLPGNWCHTEEEAMDARYAARMILSQYFASFRPQIRPVSVEEND